MVRARAAHATERADEAEAALKKVLAEKPDDFEARRMMADVHRFRGEYQKTEEALEGLWKERGFGDDSKELTPEERLDRDRLENQFNELYSTWSDSIDPEKEPDKFARVVKAGLKWFPKSAQLNRKLVEFYFARGEKLAEEGKKIEAAEAYEEIAQLRALPKQREDAAKRALDLRREAFASDVKKHFEENVKSKLVEAEQWDAENERITMRIEADVDRGLRQNREEDLAEARKQAASAIRTAIAQMVRTVANVEPLVAAAAGVKMTSGEESLRRGKYEVSVAMTVDDIIEGAFKEQEKARQAAEKAEESPAKKPEGDGDAEGGADAGSDADSGTDGGGAEE